MQTQPVPSREVSPRPSPVAIWQRLLSHLLDRHYGLTLNDTPFGKDGVIQSISMPVSHCATR
jgi:cytoskeleton-binding toxin CbtA-like protein